MGPARLGAAAGRSRKIRAKRAADPCGLRVLAPGGTASRSGRVGLVVALALLGTVFFFAWRGKQGPAAFTEISLEERYEADSRIGPLSYDCGFGAPFEADTTDIAFVLSTKLDAGALLEPQRRAKTDLSNMGQEAAEPLMRLFQSASKDRWRGGVAKNVLTVCAMAKEDWGVQIALEALRSPREELRSDGAQVLLNHPSPEHYDILAAVLPGFQLAVNTNRAVKAMHACDPERFALQVPDWIDQARPIQGYVQSSIVDTALPLAASSRSKAAAQALKHVADNATGLLPRHRPYLLAPSARLGDLSARQELLDTLASDAAKPRGHAVRALASAGLVMETYVLSVTSDSIVERATTLGQIVDESIAEDRSEEDWAEVMGWCRAALSDSAAEVREVALGALLKRGDEEGRALLMSLLGGTVDERGLAARAMRGTFEGRPEVADQARSILQAGWAQEIAGSARPVEITSILQTLGGVPGRATGDFLLECGEVLGENQVRGVDGFRWCVGQAFNAGEEARQAIRERLEVEEDPFRRLDLIQFIWQDFTKTSFDILVAVVDNDELNPHERLYAADRLVRMGRSDEALPTLKRVYRTSTSAVLRPGLHCLLWVWFGPPNS